MNVLGVIYERKYLTKKAICMEIWVCEKRVYIHTIIQKQF